MAMFEFLKRPPVAKKVSAEPVVNPVPGRAEQFVAAAKAAADSRKKAGGPSGREVYSPSPGMTDAEASKFGKADQRAVESNLAQAGEFLRPVATPEIHARITRAGVFDLDEQVEKAPTFSARPEKVGEESAEEPEMTPEEMLAKREALLPEIGSLRAQQMALDSALDPASLQKLSRVNRELAEKEALLKDLEEALAQGADSKQPGQ